MVCAPNQDDAVSNGGAGYIILGSTLYGYLSSPGYLYNDLSVADIIVYGAESDGNLCIAAGGVDDIDGDTGSEVVFGARGEGSGDGAAYLFLGATIASGGTFDASTDADVQFIGDSGTWLGARATGLGDTDNDGMGDIGLGASLDSTGTVLLFNGTY